MKGSGFPLGRHVPVCKRGAGVYDSFGKRGVASGRSQWIERFFLFLVPWVAPMVGPAAEYAVTT